MRHFFISLTLMLSTSVIISTATSSVIYAEEQKPTIKDEKTGRATIDEAEALLKKAVAFFKEETKDKDAEKIKTTLAEFSNKSGKFIDRDLYIYVIDMTGKMLAHGGNPKMVGGDLSGMKDADGKPLIQNIINAAKSDKPKGNDKFR